MNSKLARRLILVLVAIVAVVVVGAIAYRAGQGNPGVGFGPFGPVRGYHGMMGYGWGGFDGFGGWGFLGMLVIGFLIVWFLMLLVSGSGGGRPVDTSSTGGVDKLRELTELHDRGALTDEEFTAAKRKLLGM